MSEYGIRSANELATKYLGYNSAEKINRLKKENAKPGFDILQDLSNRFDDLDMNWFFRDQDSLILISNFIAGESEGVYLKSSKLSKDNAYFKELSELLQERNNYLEAENKRLTDLMRKKAIS